MESVFYNYKFQKITEIIPQKDKEGNLKEFFPQKDYKNSRNLKLHKYGHGPFCRFSIPGIHYQGVYVLCFDGKPEYVGECEDLAKRWNTGYGNIFPRNCFEGGQSTNCRINNIIFKAIKSGQKVELFFKKLTDRFSLEFELISKIQPSMNKTIGKPSLSFDTSMQKNKTKRKIYSQKQKASNNLRRNENYGKLTEYLKQASNQITLNFDQIQKIVDFSLPPSAFKHKAWWANGGHIHSKAWMDAGYRVIKPNPGIEITFSK